MQCFIVSIIKTDLCHTVNTPMMTKKIKITIQVRTPAIMGITTNPRRGFLFLTAE